MKINVEDNLHAIFTYKKRNFTLNINFLKSPPGTLFLNFKRSVEWDYTKKYMLVHNFKTNKVSKKTFKFNRNDMFKEQNKEIINSIINKKNLMCHLKKVLKLKKLYIN